MLAIFYLNIIFKYHSNLLKINKTFFKVFYIFEFELLKILKK